MAALNKFNCFLLDVFLKKHKIDTLANGGDQLMVALCASANAPVATNTVLANLTQIAYTNFSTRNIVVNAIAQTTGDLKLTLTDLVLTASGACATFRYIVIYNDTATNDELIGWIDCGSDITLNTGDTYTIDFDGTNGALTITWA